MGKNVYSFLVVAIVFLGLAFNADFVKAKTSNSNSKKSTGVQNKKANRTKAKISKVRKKNIGKSKKSRGVASVSSKKTKLKKLRGSGPIPKQVWFKWMKGDLSSEMCEPGSYTLTCFGLKKKSCERAYESAIQTCWSRESARWRMSKVRPREEGVMMGYFLGQCAGKRIEGQFKRQKKKSNECNYMNQWMGR